MNKGFEAFICFKSFVEWRYQLWKLKSPQTSALAWRAIQQALSQFLGHQGRTR